MAQQELLLGEYLHLVVEDQDEPIGFGLRDGRFNVHQVTETLRVSPLLIQFDAGGPFVLLAARQDDGLTERQFATNTEHTALLVKATAGTCGSLAAGLKQLKIEEMLRDLKESLMHELLEARRPVSTSAMLTLQRSIFAILLDQPPTCGGDGSSSGAASSSSSCQLPPTSMEQVQERKKEIRPEAWVQETLPEQVQPLAAELVEQHRQYNANPFVGCFFRERGLAATADHCLGKEKKVGDKVSVFMVYDKSTLELAITKREPGLGYALLQYEVPPDALPDAPGTAFLEVESSMDALQRGTPLALCACSPNLNKVWEAWRDRQPIFSVMPAFSLRPTTPKHHLIYSCQWFSGVSGITLVLHRNKILGLHVMGVNELKERAAHKQLRGERMDALEASVDSAVTSVAQGMVALLATSMV